MTQPMAPSTATSTSYQGLPLTDANAPVIIRRHMGILALSQGISLTVFQSVPTLGGLMMLQLTQDVALAGIASSVNAAGQFITAYWTGRMMDLHGRQKVLVYGFVLGVLSNVMIAWTFHERMLYPLLFAFFLYGLTIPAMRGLTLAAVDLYPPQRRGRALGILQTGGAMGSVIAPAITTFLGSFGYLSESLRITYIWLIGAGLYFLAVPLLSLLKPDPIEISKWFRSKHPASGGTSTQVKSESTDSARRNASVAAILVSSLVTGQMVWIMAFAPLSFHHHGFGLEAVSLAVAIHIFGMFACAYPVGIFVDRFGRKAALIGSMLVTAIGAYGAVGIYSYWPSTFFLFLVGLGWSGATITAIALLSDQVRASERGRLLGVNEMFVRVAQFGFPLILGYTAKFIGNPLTALLSGILYIIAFYYVLRLPGRAQWVSAARNPDI